MADTMLPDTTEKLSQLLGVESNERKLVSRVFIQALLIGLQNLFTRTAVFAIFLETLSASELPTIYIVAGLILPIFGTTFSRYAKTHSSLKAYRLSLALTICMLVGMRFSLDVLESSYLSIVALPIFYLITFRLLSMSLWGTANAVFTLRQSKRLYGLITAGDKFTTLIAGLLVPSLLPIIGTENLLFLSIVTMISAFFNQSQILKAGSIQEEEEEEKRAEQAAVSAGLSEDEESTYKRYMKLVLALQAAISALYFSIDNAFLTEVHSNFLTAEALASFLSYTSAATALGSIILGAISARTIVERFGTISMLQITPIVVVVLAILGASTAALLPATIWILAILTVMRVAERCLTPTVFNPSFHSLFHPLPKELGSKAHNYSITIAGPLAGAGVGLLLLALKSITTPTTALFCTLIFVSGITMIVICRQTGLLYPKVLTFAVGSRRMHNIELGLNDKHSLQLLEAGLSSQRAEEVIYSLDLLLKLRPERLRPLYPELLQHPQSLVRRHAIESIAQDLKEESTDQLVEVLANEVSPAVKATVLKAIAESNPERSHDILTPFLQVSHSRLLLTALTSLIKHGGLRSIIAAGTRLQALERSETPSERALAAQAIGEIENPSFYHGLEDLLNDEHLLVRQTALEAAGQLAAPQLLGATLNALSEPQLEAIALQSLSESGESSIDALWEAYGDDDQSFRIRRHILVLLGKMKSEISSNLLFEHLENSDPELEEELLYALHDADFKANSVHFNQIEARINLEGKRAITLLQALTAYADATMQGAIHLRETLQHEFEKVIQRMLLLACFFAPNLPFRRMYASIYLGQTKDIAFYCELVEQSLPGHIAKRLVPLIEPLDQATRVQKLANIYNEELSEPLNDLMLMANGQFASRSAWLAVCAGWFFDELTRSGSVDTGTHSLKNIYLERKVQRLQNIDIFSRCSKAMLAEALNCFEIREVKEGDVVVTKGLPQNSLYVVETGALKSTEEHFREGQCFGDEALVGAELVHETTHAETDSHIMVLSREDFSLLLQYNLPLYLSVLEGLLLQIISALTKREEKISPTPSANKQNDSRDLNSLIEQELLVKSCALFEKLDRTALQQLLISAQIITLEPGESLYQQGEPSQHLYIVGSGDITLHSDETVRLYLERGASFGKYSYLSAGGALPTNARTEQGAVVLQIDGGSIDSMIWASREQIEMTIGYLSSAQRALSPKLQEFTWF
ncbi:MAG: cyclic nucleotide-binding domain-containing protein [Deltaproteobacteria bacterium]|nr:cyclic nucleotide-binding domain-containing protein [Deltaproteobacteria bacterium]MBT6489288.1 cyclic nucleotide-binding domain-containing protein [Deltaproteobacteria bacterium]